MLSFHVTAAKAAARFRAGLRNTMAAFLCAAAAAIAAPAQAADPALPPVVVYAPSPCLACIDWADHLRKHGFTVTLREVPQVELPALKRRFGVPPEFESVHTAQVSGYFIEGHVPATDILALLKEKPRARGLAVPGLPRGAPGRESYTPVCETACTILDGTRPEHEIRREAFNTLLVGPQGRASVYARH